MRVRGNCFWRDPVFIMLRFDVHAGACRCVKSLHAYTHRAMHLFFQNRTNTVSAGISTINLATDTLSTALYSASTSYTLHSEEKTIPESTAQCNPTRIMLPSSQSESSCHSHPTCFSPIRPAPGFGEGWFLFKVILPDGPSHGCKPFPCGLSKVTPEHRSRWSRSICCSLCSSCTWTSAWAWSFQSSRFRIASCLIRYWPKSLQKKALLFHRFKCERNLIFSHSYLQVSCTRQIIIHQSCLMWSCSWSLRSIALLFSGTYALRRCCMARKVNHCFSPLFINHWHSRQLCPI